MKETKQEQIERLTAELAQARADYAQDYKQIRDERNQAQQELQRTQRDLAKLREDYQEMSELIKGNVRENLIEKLNYEKGAMEMYLKHPLFTLIAAETAAMFINSGAVNYLEVRMFAESLGYLSITVQKETGQTPHQLKVKAEQERDQAKQNLDDTRSLLMHLAEEAERLNLAVEDDGGIKSVHVERYVAEAKKWLQEQNQ